MGNRLLQPDAFGSGSHFAFELFEGHLVDVLLQLGLLDFFQLGVHVDEVFAKVAFSH